ncbi:hypothetical protein ILUMI_05481, partial [Ignelater luminosus]
RKKDQLEYEGQQSESEQEYNPAVESDESEGKDNVHREHFVSNDKKRGGTTVFSYKTKKENIIKEFPAPKAGARNITNEIDAFLQSVDIPMIEEIVECTNMYIHYKRVEYGREKDAKETSKTEPKSDRPPIKPDEPGGNRRDSSQTPVPPAKVVMPEPGSTQPALDNGMTKPAGATPRAAVIIHHNVEPVSLQPPGRRRVSNEDRPHYGSHRNRLDLTVNDWEFADFEVPARTLTDHRGEYLTRSTHGHRSFHRSGTVRPRPQPIGDHSPDRIRQPR